MTTRAKNRLNRAAILRYDDGHQEVFIAAADGSLFHRWNWLNDDRGSTWSEWHRLG